MGNGYRGGFLIVSLVSAVWLFPQQRQAWPDTQSQTETWQTVRMDALQVQSLIDSMNEQSKTKYGSSFIVKYHLDLGPLNRVQINPDLLTGVNYIYRLTTITLTGSSGC